MSADHLITSAQVAEYLRVDKKTVARWLRKGLLRGFKLGKEWRVSREDLRLFIEQRANRPREKRRLGT